MKGMDELDYSTMLTLTRAGITTIEQLESMTDDEIRRLMGHTVVQTTLRYIYADETQLRAAYNKYVA